MKGVEVKSVESMPAVNVKGKVTAECTGWESGVWFQLRTGATGKCKITCLSNENLYMGIYTYDPETREIVKVWTAEMNISYHRTVLIMFHRMSMALQLWTSGSILLMKKLCR